MPLGPYTLVRRLAKGGMAELFVARKEGPDGFAREVAVKRILPHLSEDPKFEAMFREEARIVARLDHPNVVNVYDFGIDQGSSYLVMELVRGVDLLALMRRAAPGGLPPHHAAKVLSFVCEGLAHAHALSENGKPVHLVHRDITPANVLLSFEGAVKIVDFGVAKLMDRTREQTRVRGKYAYLSPEQARGERLDARSDLYNVGILLFEMVAGTPLFPHKRPQEALSYSARGELPRPERLQSLPPDLRRIALRALAAKREDRYPDALSLRADLEQYLRKAPPSDSVELGRYLRGLFPDVVATDQKQGPRAAGTVPVDALDVALEEVLLGGTEKLGPGEVPEHTGKHRTGEQRAPSSPSDFDASATPALSSRELRGEPGRAPSAPPSGAEAQRDDPLDITAVDASPEEAPAEAMPAPPETTAGPGSAEPAERPAQPAFDPTVRQDALPEHLAAALATGSQATASEATASQPAGNPGTASIRRLPKVLLALAMLAVASLAAFFIAPSLGRPEAPGGLQGPLPPLPGPAPRTPARPPAAAAPLPTGSLALRTTPPGLELRIDGRAEGPAPLVTTLAAGSHHVEVLRGDEVVASREAEVLPGELQQLHLEVEVRTVPLHLASHPNGAEVSIDGELLGRTPVTVQVDPGTLHLAFHLDAHAPLEQELTVVPDVPSNLTVTLMPTRDSAPRRERRPAGSLTIATTPWAEVFLGQRRLGVTPLTNIRLPAGRHQLTLRSPGRASKRIRVTIRSGEATRVRETL